MWAASTQGIRIGGVLLGAALVAALASPVSAGTLLQIDDDGQGLYVSPPIGFRGAFASGFHLDATFTQLSVEILIGSFNGVYPAGKAFLTTAIGVGTTPASEIVQTALSYPSISSPSAYTTVFTGLTLGPGDYYLVLESPIQGPTEPLAFFLGDTVTTFGGISFLGDFGRVPADAYAPATDFVGSDVSNYRIRISGERAVDVPAPDASALLAGLAVLLCAGLRSPRPACRRPRIRRSAGSP